MRSEKEIKTAIRSMSVKANKLKPLDCGRYMFGDRIDALEWVLQKSDFLCGYKVEKGKLKELIT